MTLMKDMLTKSLKKGRLKAVTLLNDLARIGGIPEPHYEYKPGGNVRKPVHFYKLRFRVPQFLQQKSEYEIRTIVGAGRCRSKQDAKSLAALEAVHRLEEMLDANRGGLQQLLEEYRLHQQEQQDAVEATPVTDEIDGVSWTTVPLDPSFSPTLPANRFGRIQFNRKLIQELPEAFLGARAVTLTSEGRLPQVDVHANQTDIGVLQRFANVVAGGKIKGVNGPSGDINMGISDREAQWFALQQLGVNLLKNKPRRSMAVMALVEALEKNTKVSSFGMAKLFVKLPKHHFEDIQKLVDKLDSDTLEAIPEKRRKKGRQRDAAKAKVIVDDGDALESRVQVFREHQKELNLPVDSVETQIPHDAAVTIVRGGTGSGKTTRYPLMLSLFSPNGAGSTSVKILVVQPRRLACQTAAHRVAYEQGYKIGQDACPIGYSIRFESFPSAAEANRTVDFLTPGVLLRRATDDLLLSDVTHLCIDEIHERNADMDLLVALAKQAQREREDHPTLPPLRLVLMSATLDSSQWESYFDDNGESNGKKPTVEVVNVPNVRRFPIDLIHLGEQGFPLAGKKVGLLKKEWKDADDTFDEAVCSTTADLVLSLIKRDALDQGSVLCFLPGIDEIRMVDRIIQSGFANKKFRKERPTIRYLHSSLSSREQAKVFRPGPKVILSTNLAETSVTIPDVKIVIDSGRERQFSLLDSSSDSETTTVVGSQLATVNISQAAAQQRAGRAGRVSAGTCYRLYTKEYLQSKFTQYTLPEMQRMDLSQLVLHSASLYHPASGHPLSLLLGAPDAPTELRLRQTLYGLRQQGLVRQVDGEGPFDWKKVEMTPLGEAVSKLPASPRIGRMLFMGLGLRAIDPALTIASLLSVPNSFSSGKSSDDSEFCSDVVEQMLAYQGYLELDKNEKQAHRRRSVFEQVSRVRRQLEHSIQSHLKPFGDTWDCWNANSHRVAAQAAIICGVTPHIAHLVNGRGDFATRDVAGNAKIHPGSVNFSHDRRAHWYMYHELRTTRAPYLHVTTAASPLELALFSDSTYHSWLDDDEEKEDGEELLDLDHGYDFGSDNWLFIADQWVPVEVSAASQRETFTRLKRVLMYNMLQQVAHDPRAFADNETYRQLVLFVLAAIEQQRLPK